MHKLCMIRCFDLRRAMVAIFSSVRKYGHHCFTLPYSLLYKLVCCCMCRSDVYGDRISEVSLNRNCRIKPHKKSIHPCGSVHQPNG